MVFTSNDDAKIFLKEKLGALVTDEQLDKVAGGTMDENSDILSAMARIAPEKVAGIINTAAVAPTEAEANAEIRMGVQELLKDNFGVFSVSRMNSDNTYGYNGKIISHEQLMKMINAKPKG